ncbi:MAG: hypothetical protein KDA96_28445, partial [Planctomycetaceae bacterium]|nr:hypothetical protein [Planctomycetaceae bacterium]
AYHARRYRGEPGFDEWIGAILDLAIDELCEEDRWEELKGLPVADPEEPRYAVLIDETGIEEGCARKACVLFNSLPVEERRTFYAVFIDLKTIHQHVAQGNGPPNWVVAQLEHAIRTISGLGSYDAPPPKREDFLP